MKNESIALTGEAAEKLSPLYRIGTGLFIVGLLLLLDGYFFHFVMREKPAQWWSFGLMLIGSILFTLDTRKGVPIISLFTRRLNLLQALGLTLGLIGSVFILLPYFGIQLEPVNAWFWATLPLAALGMLLYIIGTYAHHPKGIKNNYVMFNSLSARGLIGWLVAIVLTVFYIELYWYGKRLEPVVHLFDPLSQLLRGKVADKWFVYGSLYTFIITGLGIKFMIKYRHNRYQLIRTSVVIFSQVVFAYFLPQILESMQLNYATDAAGNYLGGYSSNPVYTWPLNDHFFTAGNLEGYAVDAYQPLGMSYFVWGLLMFLVITPVVTYYVGKRWYCSWFCGCGGLAETAGDSFRHLSSKSLLSWKIERWVIHSVMVLVLIMTLAVLISYFSGKEYHIVFLTVNKTMFYICASLGLLGMSALFLWWNKKQVALGFASRKVLTIGAMIGVLLFILLSLAYFTGYKNVFLFSSAKIKDFYGFFVGVAFSGVIGVGFYPVLGSRVWCRFGCPMAGYLGIFQRFKSRFRITTNGGQCISCGNCSTYCEQGIDVRAYAQRGQNIVRASCVGCGICSAVCPRGVLKLENGPEEGRLSDEPNLIGMIK